MKIIIVKNYDEISKKAAKIIADVIKEKEHCNLGLATGSTPIGTYEELIKMYKRNELSFKNVSAYNLDEYVGLSPNSHQSYKYFMDNILFNHIDIDKEKCFIPNGTADNLLAEVNRYDKLLRDANYTDLQLLGIGNNGHIAFNEPADTLKLSTHIVKLKKETITANSRFFNSINEVPKSAISLGFEGIMMSKKILLLASGENKARAIANMLNDVISTNNPSSLLNLHHDVTVIVDEAAAKLLGK